MNQPPVVRVGLIEGHVLLREAVRVLLNESGQIQVVAEAGEGADVAGMLKQHRPDVVLLVLDGTGEREFSLLSLVSDIADQTNVLVVTAHHDSALHTQAIELGARGVVMLNQSAQVLVKAIRKVCEGEVWLDRSLLGGVLDKMTQPDVDPEKERIASLTDKERAVISLIAEGLKNKQISQRLFISESTVTHHLSSIFAKLDVSDRLELLIYAVSHDLAKMPQKKLPTPANRQ